MPQVKSKRYFIVMQSFTMEEQPKNECFSSSILFISFVPQFQHLKGPIKVQDRGGGLAAAAAAKTPPTIFISKN